MVTTLICTTMNSKKDAILPHNHRWLMISKVAERCKILQQDRKFAEKWLNCLVDYRCCCCCWLKKLAGARLGRVVKATREGRAIKNIFWKPKPIHSFPWKLQCYLLQSNVPIFSSHNKLFSLLWKLFWVSWKLKGASEPN